LTDKDPRLTVYKRDVIDDPRVQASLRRLKSMGLRYEITQVDTNTLIMVIEAESIINYIIRRMYELITYPKKKIYYDQDEDVLVIKIEREG
jgi:hypothetical protein